MAGTGTVGVKVVLTAFDGSLILFSPIEEPQQTQTQPAPATTFATLPRSTSSAPPAAANQTNQTATVKPPVVALPAPPGPIPSPPPSTLPSVPFAGAHVAIQLLIIYFWYRYIEFPKSPLQVLKSPSRCQPVPLQ